MFDLLAAMMLVCYFENFEEMEFDPLQNGDQSLCFDEMMLNYLINGGRSKL